MLSAWAELVADAAPAEAAALLARACEAYEAASAAAPAEEAADVELLRSWADALVRRAELAAGAGDGASADACYGRALGAYAAACGGADSTKGDDVAGLLYNWGCGLQSLAKHRPGPAGPAQHLELAAAKLRTAAEFGAGDADPLNALGAPLSFFILVPPMLSMRLVLQAMCCRMRRRRLRLRAGAARRRSCCSAPSTTAFCARCACRAATQTRRWASPRRGWRRRAPRPQQAMHHQRRLLQRARQTPMRPRSRSRRRWAR